MILIFGGAYQGKLAYALDNYKQDKEQVFFCSDTDISIDTDKKIISGLHLYILALIKSGDDPVKHIEAQLTNWHNKILLCDDINSGVVPIDPELRKWREAVGRCMTLLARESDEVVRLFCGIGKRIK